MKRYEFRPKDFEDVKTICKHDGEIAYCNALSVNGLCKCNECLCDYAIAIIATKNGYTKHIVFED